MPTAEATLATAKAAWEAAKATHGAHRSSKAPTITDVISSSLTTALRTIGTAHDAVIGEMEITVKIVSYTPGDNPAQLEWDVDIRRMERAITA